jgi:mono/diheme cytochrome c family protein
MMRGHSRARLGYTPVAAFDFDPDCVRTAVENAALSTRTARLSAPEQVGLCAACHARRAQFQDQGMPGGELLDRYLPVALSPGVFHADGQIEATRDG